MLMLLVACSTSGTSIGLSVDRLDKAASVVRDASTKSARVDLGRTLDVDHLIVYYQDSKLVMAEAIYVGYTTTHDTFYMVSAGVPDEIVADEVMTTGSQIKSARYYIVNGAIEAKRDDAGTHAAAPSDNIAELARIVRTTAARAARGEVVSMMPTRE